MFDFFASKQLFSIAMFFIWFSFFRVFETHTHTIAHVNLPFEKMGSVLQEQSMNKIYLCLYHRTSLIHRDFYNLRHAVTHETVSKREQQCTNSLEFLVNDLLLK